MEHYGANRGMNQETSLNITHLGDIAGPTFCHDQGPCHMGLS